MNSLDARVAWTVPMPGITRLQVYLETFNLLNKENVALVNNNYGLIAGSPAATWLRPTQYFPPREIQLGARFSF
jgi:hypothetical protein